MKYTDLIFDLYGTLVDTHTEEGLDTWERTAIYYGFYGAHYTGQELKNAFQCQNHRSRLANFQSSHHDLELRR